MKSFSVVNKNLDKIIYKNIEHDEFLEGEKLQGEFIATNDFLGQVSVRFYNFQRINPDSVIFRIKEKGSDRWFYENTYKTNQFQPNQLFPFGFPLINDSKGKTYIFEVESLDGLPEHSIGLSRVKPLGAVLYQYPKSYLLSSPFILIDYVFGEKIEKIELNYKNLVALGIYLNFIFLSLFLINLAYDNLNKFKLIINSTNVLLLGILVLILSAFVLYLKKEAFSLNLTIIAYFILVVGVIWNLVEVKISKK